METLTARVVGFEARSPVTYTTEIALSETVRYALAIRYSAFFTAYVKLVEKDRTFVFDFPKKGGFFSSPTPEERQPQLDAFLKAALAHLAKQAFPPKLCAVMEQLLDVAAHAAVAEKEEKVMKENKEDEKEDAAGSETSESSMEEPVAEPIAQLVATQKVKETAKKEEEVEATPAPIVAEATAEDVAKVDKPVEEVKVEMSVAAEEVPPVKEVPAVEAITPVEEVAAVEEATPVEESPPTEETTLMEEIPAVVEQVKEKLAIVETPTEQVESVQATQQEPVAEPVAAVVTPSPSSSSSSKKKKKSRAKPTASSDPFSVTSKVTTTTSTGGEVQHITFANGMSLKKKTLSEEQKRLRNMRRKEKRRKASLKIRGGKSVEGTPEITSSTDESDSY